MSNPSPAARFLAIFALVHGVGSGGSASAAPAAHKVRTQRHRGRAPAFPAGADASPASRAARLTEEECLRELRERDVRFDKAGPARGVLIPVRLLGPVRGVVFRTDFPDRQRAKVPFEVFDCRLVVALSEWSPTLVAHGIDEVRMFSAWRPPSPRFPEGKTATGHPGALAADLRLFKRKGGAAFDVEADFHGRVGERPCGAGAAPPAPDTPEARALHAIYCAAAEGRFFHVMLSPDHDRSHRNHFHVEVRPAVRWFIAE
jgi:hypothetical protein